MPRPPTTSPVAVTTTWRWPPGSAVIQLNTSQRISTSTAMSAITRSAPSIRRGSGGMVTPRDRVTVRTLREAIAIFRDTTKGSNWTLEDRGSTNPLPGGKPSVHFRSLDDSESELARVCKSCNFDRFIRAGHNMQDFFSHYGQGYRWIPSEGSLGHGIGSVVEPYVKPPLGMDQTPPDDAAVYSAAWEAAYKRTAYWLGRWKNCCQKDQKGAWTPKSPQPAECGNGPPENEFGDEPPKPKPIRGYWGARVMQLENGLRDWTGQSGDSIFGDTNMEASSWST